MKKLFDWCKLVFNGFQSSNCSLHAAGLTYFSLLAVVPIICCILVCAKMCGVDHYARTQINSHIDAMIANIEHGQDDVATNWLPMFNDDSEQVKKQAVALEFGKQARRISNAIFSRIESFDIKTFGWIGFVMLLWTVISSLGMVEASFNGIWKVDKPRPIWMRAYMYIFILVILPILMAMVMSMPMLNLVKDVILATFGATKLTSWLGDGLIWLIDSFIFRVLFTLLWSALSCAFLFWIMPHCKVRFRYAWYGGLITSILFIAWGKICAIAQVGIAKSSALYGSFAFLPIVLAWMYMSWEIVLLGANIVKVFDSKR